LFFPCIFHCFLNTFFIRIFMHFLLSYYQPMLLHDISDQPSHTAERRISSYNDSVPYALQEKKTHQKPAVCMGIIHKTYRCLKIGDLPWTFNSSTCSRVTSCNILSCSELPPHGQKLG
jgi:hypothetical protein